MKKLLVIPVWVLYFIAITGVMIHAHYCGDTLADWRLYKQAASCCDGGCQQPDEKTGERSCCNDKVVSVKLLQDQNLPDLFKVKTSASFDWAYLPGEWNDFSCVYARSSSIPVELPQSPLDVSSRIPLYKKHSSFIFYG